MGKCWKKLTSLPDSVDWEFHTPPENQGQIVTISYACGDGMVFCRWHDASDGETRLYWRDMKNSDEDCDVWNHAPEPTRVCGSERYL